MIITLDDEDMTALAAMAGITLDEGQAALLAAGMRKGSDGKWAQFQVTVPGSQGAVTRVRELAGLFLLRERVLHVSAGHAQSAEEARKMTGIVTGRPDLARKVTRVSRVHGGERITVDGGGEIRYMTPPSCRGYAADLIVFRPGRNLDDKVLAAVLPCAAGRPDPQIWMAGA
jgi:hypothetical protein